mgnify:CR=1 FL=1
MTLWFKKIIRVEADGTPYEVFFTKNTVKKLAQNYLAKKYTDSATLEHGDKKIKGVTLVESWIKDGQFDKSNNYGLNLPKGTWVGLMKITDDKLWNEFVKSGKIKGFSIEGLFSHKLVKASLDETLLSKKIEELSVNSGIEYFKIFNSAIYVFKNQFWLGSGTKSYLKSCVKLINYNKNLLCAPHPHNIYLEILNNQGIIGAIIFFTFLTFN